jgi:ABC-type maltose transport system permease subunit
MGPWVVRKVLHTPVAVLFVFLQRHLIRGVTAGASQG